MSEPAAIQYRPLRAPREHGATLIEPPLEQLPHLLRRNRMLLAARHGEMLGLGLAAAARQARRELIEQALAYTRAYRDVTVPTSGDAPLLLTGHQPELYHPGVWFKNFALSASARRLDAHAIHLLIDNDAVSAPAIRVPVGSPERPRVERVALDAASPEVPYEERSILSSDLFSSFGSRIRARLSDSIARPVVDSLWPLAQSAASRTGRLGLAVSQARHRLEGEWGLMTCELPLSVVCQGAAFRHFAAHLLAELPRFREAYNESLREYRRVHRLRSRTHPVPELAVRDGWLESPFWIWSSEHPQRRRLHIQRHPQRLAVSDLAHVFHEFHWKSDGNAADLVAQMDELERRGVRLRPRALITTMFARLFLGDVFFHGIGGAKYDQLTDVIIARFFGIEPPAFVVLTATAQLFPGPTNRAQSELLRIRQTLRDLRFNPQRHLPRNEQAESLIAEKLRWLHDPPVNDRRLRHRMIERINADLQPHVSVEAQRLTAEQERIEVARNSQHIAGSREYSFCLHPTDALRSFLLDI
jgi:hypothetical protein